MSLSIHSAEARTPAPTYGTPASSRSPWTVPSSPNGPCRTGKTTSTSASIVATSLPGRRTGSSGRPAEPSCQRPSRAISIPSTSSPADSSARTTLSADAIEIGFSLDLPPRITAILIPAPAPAKPVPSLFVRLRRAYDGASRRRRGGRVRALVAALLELADVDDHDLTRLRVRARGRVGGLHDAVLRRIGDRVGDDRRRETCAGQERLGRRLAHARHVRNLRRRRPF